ncbi:L,D-transpeptidase [Candidatus Synchoanobacter obligatus]|uniref:L,D-transpeptidase n=1 Tax=Candidatus Synchoanobacter obligatus TaxID=2919597 RepID=A0ABT1L4K7_9GAMM|nr:L,D-transpeptidase [Candidatus Synchoanobacter obligatus]MCP8351856.1 L,D-transpeptidase [Candidatus Synchoanobacter obligatus]
MHSLKKNESCIFILGRIQELRLCHQGQILKYPISTAKRGYGEQHNSFKTPRGWHYVRAIIGKEQPINTFFKARRPSNLSQDISGRILWLCGLESHNHTPQQHSMLRYIYIHGTPRKFLKTPSSIGCINMYNQDIAALCQKIPRYCKVFIDGEE